MKRHILVFFQDSTGKTMSNSDLMVPVLKCMPTCKIY